MNARRIIELQRLVDEAQAGFPVDADPWRLVDELLDEVEFMRAVHGYRGWMQPGDVDHTRRAG